MAIRCAAPRYVIYGVRLRFRADFTGEQQLYQRPHQSMKEVSMPKRSGVESGAGGASSHRGGAGPAGAGAQSGAGNSKKKNVGRKKSTSGPKK